jgi:hypothetical protein
VRPATGVLQRSATAAEPDYADALLDEAKDSGARLAGRATDWIDLDSVKRSYFSWFSRSILSSLGVGPKPANGYGRGRPKNKT